MNRITSIGRSLALLTLLAVPAGAQTVTPGGGATIPGAGPAPTAPAPADARETIRRWFDGFEFVPRAEHFARLGPDAAPALVTLAVDPTEHLIVRARAVSAMVHLDDPASLIALKVLLESPEAPSVLRRKAALALAEREGAGAMDRLANVLLNATDDVPLREACARGLRGMGPAAFETRDALLRVETAPTVRGLLGAEKRIGLD